MPTTEERLAALEARMAAWIDQQPTNYYTHQYSGEEIDNAVARALPNGAIDQAAGTFVRPNLLDNWYFGRPVNQRGVEEFAAYSYGLDRWWPNSSITGAITYRDNRLVIANQAGLVQKMDDYTPLNGKIVTISSLTTDNELFWSTGLFVDKDHDLTFDSGDIIQFYYSTYFSGWQFYVKHSRNILAVKLELGPTQTLAHREGDRWVLNEVPDYGEQLRRCQRYYYQVHYNQYETIGFAYDGPEYAFIIITLPTEMRGATPTLKIIGDISIGGKVRTLTGCSCHGCEAIIGVNYTAQPSSAGATYAYSTSAGGVTIQLIYDL